MNAKTLVVGLTLVACASLVNCSSKKDTVASDRKPTTTVAKTAATSANLGASSSGRGR